MKKKNSDRQFGLRLGIAWAIILTFNALFLFATSPTSVAAAVSWALSRAGSTLAIDSAGQINITPKSGKTTVVTRSITLNGGATVPTGQTVALTVEKLTGTTAAGSGTALLTNNTNAGISIKATANTVTAGTLTGTGASLQMAAGDRLGIKYETAPTEGAAVVVTVTLKRI